MLPVVQPYNVQSPSKMSFLEILKFLVSRKHFEEEETIKRFENKFASFIGSKYATTASSGRSAFYLILESLKNQKKIKKGDEILMSSLNFHPIPRIAKAIGLKVKFVDIDPETLNMDPYLMEEDITPKTKIMLATHIFGSACDMGKIKKMSKKHDLIVIEDCAHTVGGKFKDKNLGSIGEAAFYSFEINKPINTFGGSMILTNNKKLYSNILDLKKGLENEEILFPKILRYYLYRFILSDLIFTFFVYPLIYLLNLANIELLSIYKKIKLSKPKLNIKPKRYTNLQAHIGLAQIEKISNVNNIKIKNFNLFKSLLQKNKSFSMVKDTSNNPLILFPLISKKKTKKELCRELIKKGVIVNINFIQNCESFLTKKKNLKCLNALNVDKNCFQVCIKPDFKEKRLFDISKALEGL